MYMGFARNTNRTYDSEHLWLSILNSIYKYSRVMTQTNESDGRTDGISYRAPASYIGRLTYLAWSRSTVPSLTRITRVCRRLF